MKRKMAYIGTFYLAGLFSASFLSRGFNLAAAAVFVLTAVSAIVVYKGKYIKTAVCFFSAAAGMFLYSAYDALVYENIIKYNGCDVEVVGKVLDCSEYSGDKTLYTVKGIINGDAAAEVSFFTDSSNAEIGDEVRVIGKAAELKDSYKFPAKSYYKAKGIYLRIDKVSHFNFTHTKFSFKRLIDSYRLHILDVINDKMDGDCAAVMSAMLFGDKSAIDSSEKTLMYRAGIGHIMAVSGVHLSVVCSFFWLVISRLPISRYFRFGLLMVPVVCFVMLAGMSNSVIRAAIMIALVYGAGLFRRRADTFNSLGIAVILLTAASPFAVRDASFLLSVAGVFGIGVAAPVITAEIEKKRKLGGLAKPFIASVCVMVIVFPVTLLFFDEVSAVSPISNLILLPICTVILVGGVVVMLTGGLEFTAVPVLKICELCCRAVMIISEFIGQLRFSYIPLGSDFVLTVNIIAVVSAVLLLLVFGKRKCGIFLSSASLVLAMMLSCAYKYAPNGNITVAVFREGSAVTAVIHGKRSACVVDLKKGGGASGSVVKYLNRNGIYHLEAVILNADVNTSLPVYSSSLELFDTDTVLVPDEDMYLADGYSSFHTESYSKDGGCVEIGECSINFFQNGVVAVNCYGENIIMYGSNTDTVPDIAYSAAVRYSGKAAEADADAEVIAAMDENAEVTAKSGTKVYIGKNVKFIIDSDGAVYSEEIK
ncbi:MAG: ComEC/Rec2 family competence protein [Oscillospiraceae bacterium]|nr:ComEC/Rec2 family competence protein [Oscillospiraceae bacterium]